MATRLFNPKKYLHKLLIITMVAFLALGGSACKSKKKAAEAADAAAEKAKIEQELALQRQREEEMARKDAEEKARAEAEAERKAKMNSPQTRLSNYFESIATAPSTAAANNNIREALGLFASPQTPVLIVISQSGTQKDYDRPVTIEEYLNYLKDQKKNLNKIQDIKYDASNKITELELVKQK